MASFEGFGAEFRRNGIPRWPENRMILAFVLIGTFALAWNDTFILGSLKRPGSPWSPEVIIFALIAAVIAIYTNVLVQKAFALRRGLKTTANWNPIKIAFGALVPLFTNGFVPVVFPPDLDAKLQPYQRVGKWRYDVNLKDYAKMGAAGIIANVLLASVLVAIFGMDNPLVRAIVIALAFTAVGTVLPIPRSPGFFLLFVSHVYYAIVAGIAGIAVLLAITGSVPLAYSLGFALLLLFWVFVIMQVDKVFDL